MSTDKTPNTELTDQQLEPVVGGYIYTSTWPWVVDTVHELKAQGLKKKDLYKWFVEYRKETGLKDLCTADTNPDFDSILDYAYEVYETA